MNEKIKFVVKVTAAHFVSYLICGLIFSKLFNYEALFKLGNVQYFMKDAYSISSSIGLGVQIFRGAFIGCVLLLLRDAIFKKKYNWLYIWLIFAGLGIVCTPAAAPFSIEGLVYSQLPLEFHLKIAPELLVQTLVFSVFITKNFNINPFEKYKISIIVTIISCIGFSISGIILALVLKADIMRSANDPFAFLIMFASMAVVFFMTELYLKKTSKIFKIIYYLVYYLAMAVLPTLYNYLTNSILKSPLSLIFSGLPVIAIGIYLLFIKKIR